MADKNTIKNWFRTNLKPTQAQFWALLDSYRHNDEKIPITAIDDIEAILDDKADAEALTNHKNDAVAHAELFLNKEDKTEKGAINGYAPLNEFTKIASEYLNVVNDLITGGATDLLSAEQGVVLQTQIDEISVLLASNDVNLDNVQELVDAIKTVQTSLETILVNDFTTGGTTKAATAETVKILKVLVDQKLSDASLKTINGISLIGPGENIVIPVRLKEVVVQNKSQLLGNLSSDVLYLIDGSFSLLAGETIVVPVGGLNIMGYSFDASRIASYGVANHTIFTSPAGGSGNLIIHNIAFNATGTGAKVFDIIDVDGTHAVEMVTVNFEGCKSIGKLKNYRQGTGITIGFYGCADGLMLSGTWTGFKLTNTNCFGFGATGTLFKKDVDTIFSNRLYLEINADFQTGSKLADFQASNFSLNELFQINASILKYNGTINDANATTVIPNIKANDVKCLWRSNVGLPDTALEKYVENSAVTGVYEINWLVDTYYLTLTGNTTFTESNLPASGKNTEELKIYLAGNFTPTFPAAWEVNKVGTFKKGEMNQITLKFIKTGVYFMKIDNSLTVYPEPNVSGVFPNSILPDATSAFTVYGSFFTPATIVSIASHTVNSVTFINQGELLLSVTAANLEGDFALTISNGTTVVYNNRVSVYLGVVFVPKLNDWINVSGDLDISKDGEVLVTTNGITGFAEWNKRLDISKNFQFRFTSNNSVLNPNYLNGYNNTEIILSDTSGSKIIRLGLAITTDEGGRHQMAVRVDGSFVYNKVITDSTVFNNQNYKIIKNINGIYMQVNQEVVVYLSDLFIGDVKVEVKVTNHNFINIKYIELT